MHNRSSAGGVFTPFRTAATITLVSVIVVLIFASPFGGWFARQVRQAFENASARVVTVVTPGPVIIQQLQALNRLETARQVSQQVVEASAKRPYIPAFLASDRVMMLVQTEAIAGIDMSGLAAEDVTIKDSAVTLRLSAPCIFTVRVDDEYSKVFSRDRGLLVVHPDSDLERQARLKAVADARLAARREILPAARANAETSLRTLLGTMGFDSITIIWGDQAA